MSECTTGLAAGQREDDSAPQIGDFMAVVARYQGPLLRYVGRMLGGVEDHQGEGLPNAMRCVGDPEDVVQETFIRLHRQVSMHGPDSVKHLTTWLFRVAHNLTLDVLRRRMRRKSLPPGGSLKAEGLGDGLSIDARSHPQAALEAATREQAEEMDALGEMIRQEARQVVLRELAGLDDLYRQVVLLKVVQGMSLRQVAEVVGVSLSTVNYRLNQGLSLLAQRLKRAGVV